MVVRNETEIRDITIRKDKEISVPSESMITGIEIAKERPGNIL